MHIRYTPHACFVMLGNGLTLELFYDESLTGTRPSRTDGTPHDAERALATASQGVWLMGETVLFEVSAGQA